ncbi:MAG: UvrD-helicase domain-containing protein [Chthonomonadales bacterium]|nr:UvrD-helicase domain-containing protein [Chthonomonadales bacterium]
MTDWARVRAAAREARAGLVDGPEGGERGTRAGALARIVPADDLLTLALAARGLARQSLPPDDPILGGAHAVLDPGLATVWHRDDMPPARARFTVAHELAHAWLHERRAECGEEDLSDAPVAEPLPYGEEYVSGYGPVQAREVEANVFAAEFLLPTPQLRDAFLVGATARDIARRSGLSRAAVDGQLAEALLRDAADPLLPAPRSEDARVGLDASQRAAVARTRRPVLVAAGPGTGKTRALVARALGLLTGGVPPHAILALTFSNRSAAEMRQRLAAADPEAARIPVFTFHGFGLELLRSHGTRLGLPPAPRLVDSLEALALLDDNLGRLGLVELEYLHSPAYPMPEILAAISRAKDELVDPEGYASLAAAMEVEPGDEAGARYAARAREVAGAYAAWQAILRERGLLDYGDLIARSVELLQSHPDVLAEARARAAHVLVDEYQDVNHATAVLVRLIAGDGSGLWVVGDARQAIYRFRGASPANMPEFGRDYAGAAFAALGVNYRSRPGIVAALNAAAAGLVPDGGETWVPAREPAGETVTLAVADDAASQAEGIARTMRDLMARGVPLSEQAVLCRTNAQAAEMAAAIEERGIPCLCLGDLMGRPEVRDMLALVSVAAEGGGAGIVRVARFAEYGVPAGIAAEAARAGRDWASEDAPLHPGLLRLVRHLAALRRHGDAHALLSGYLFGRPRYLRALIATAGPAARQRRSALYQLLLLARAHAARRASAQEAAGHGPPGGGEAARGFLAFVRALVAAREDARARTIGPDAQVAAVRLLTVHACKGLEFEAVFVPNLAHGLFPPRHPGALVKDPPGLRALGAPAGSEEGCLLFVAMSRARSHLFLSRPARVGGRERAPSALWDAVLGALGGDLARRTEWHAAPARPVEPAEAAVATQTRFPDDIAYPADHLEQYDRCPRRYYYARVLGLGAEAAPSAYGVFQRALWSTMRWIEGRRRAGKPARPAEALERWEREWNEGGMEAHAHAGRLRERAARALEAVCSLEAGAAHEVEVLVPRPAGLVRARLDRVRCAEDGEVVVERIDTGRPAEADRRDARLALMREAAHQRFGPEAAVRLRRRYVAAGEVLEAPEQPRLEPARLARYDSALSGIRAGRFEPRPSEEACPRCPFWIICPA